MIAKILALLCDYADELASQGMMKQKKTVDKCISIIHKVYFGFQDNRIEVDMTEEQVNDIIDKCILKMDGIHIYTDGETKVYEAKPKLNDPRIFYSTTEVLEFLVDTYNKAILDRKEMCFLRKELNSKRGTK